MKRMVVILILALISLLTLNFECGRGYINPPNAKYWFKVKAAITPYQTDYHVGDTIYVSVSIPGKKMYDTISRQLVRYDSASFSTETSVHIVYNNPLLVTGPFASYVFPNNVVGSVSNYGGYTNADATFGCSPSDDYNFTLGIVLLQKGTFELSFASPGPYVSKCFTGSFGDAGIAFAFDVSDTHLSLYQQLPFDSIGLAADPNVVSHLAGKSSVLIKVE